MPLLRDFIAEHERSVNYGGEAVRALDRGEQDRARGGSSSGAGKRAGSAIASRPVTGGWTRLGLTSAHRTG